MKGNNMRTILGKRLTKANIGIKNFLQYCVTAVVTVGICIGLLSLSSMIPRSAIMPQLEESSDYFYNHDLFPRFIGDQLRTMQDNFSDCNIWNIMLYVDQKHPFTSPIEARFYQPDAYGMQVGFKTAVDYYRGGDMYSSLPKEALNAFEDTTGSQLELLPKANEEYARYWHGSMVYFRLLSLFLNIIQIRILMGIIIILCFGLCSILLWKYQCRAEAILMWLAFVLLQGWMFFTSLEYSNVVVWASVFSLLAVIFVRHRKIEQWTNFFIVSGIVTAFVDFLTTETLTLTMPLLLIILIYRKNGQLQTIRTSCKNKLQFLWKTLGKNTLAWGLGYSTMFSIKWLLVYLIMGKSAFVDSLDEGFLRMGGSVYLGNSNLFDKANLLQQYEGAVWHNLAMLFPFNSVISFHTTMFCFFGICFVILLLVYLFRVRIEWGFYGLVGVLGLLPIFRFLLLSNHSYIHFFFTYRAMLPTVFIMLLFLWENGIPMKSKKKF